MTDKNEIDQHSGVETTGHEWDGLKELNHPAPRWWLIVFILTCIWAVGYWVVYPAWPTLSGNTKGTANWTSHKKLSSEQAEITERRGEFAAKIKTHSLEEIQTTPNYMLSPSRAAKPCSRKTARHATARAHPVGAAIPI